MTKNLEQVRSRLIAISLKHSLTENDAPEIENLFNLVADAPISLARKDCLEIITKRLWMMPFDVSDTKLPF
jgi:hypothetical protein